MLDDRCIYAGNYITRPNNYVPKLFKEASEAINLLGSVV